VTKSRVCEECGKTYVMMDEEKSRQEAIIQFGVDPKTDPDYYSELCSDCYVDFMQYLGERL
jgi:hypothetical protein